MSTKEQSYKNNAVNFLAIAELEKAAKKQDAGLSEVIDAVRAEWLKTVPFKNELVKICNATGIQLPKANKKLYALACPFGFTAKKWKNGSFHSAFRFHLPLNNAQNPMQKPNIELLFKLFGKFYKGKEKEILQTLQEFDLSIRPANFAPTIINSEAVKNFLPEIGQKFKKDPFGVQRIEHLVLEKQNGKLYYLATRKKEHGTYLAILETVAYCTGGCSGCYRGEQTRKLEKFTAIYPDGTEEKVYFLSPSKQIERLVKKWNQEKDPPEDILFSGGEPMEISLQEWKKIFKSLEKAKHLKFFRICTGDLFIGGAFRIADEKFLKMLEGFYKKSGKPVKFAANLPHPAFITLEAAYAIMKLHKLGIGIEIQTQTGLWEGNLCFQKEIEQKIKQFNKEELSKEEIIEAWAPSIAKSFKLLQELCIKTAMISHRPYKFIHDMQQSVSVVYNIVLYSMLSEPHIYNTDAAVRPTSFAIFTPKLPNLNVGFHTLEYLADAEKAYEVSSNEVVMRIPHSVGEIAEYKEPLWKGINDKNTLTKIADIECWKKLREKVKELVKK